MRCPTYAKGGLSASRPNNAITFLNLRAGEWSAQRPDAEWFRLESASGCEPMSGRAERRGSEYEWERGGHLHACDLPSLAVSNREQEKAKKARRADGAPGIKRKTAKQGAKQGATRAKRGSEPAPSDRAERGQEKRVPEGLSPYLDTLVTSRFSENTTKSHNYECYGTFEVIKF